MASDKDSFIAKMNLLNKLWVILGCVLGVIFSLIVVTERAQNLFSQLGIFEKPLNVVVTGFLGIEIAKQCKPTKKALIGGVIFPVLLIAELFFANTPKPISPTIIVGFTSVGVLAGILIGTAWQGALIGAVIMAFIIIVIAPILRGTIGWGWFFIPMGAIAGAALQMAFNDFVGKRTAGNKREIPDWLRRNRKDD
jgi:hypothetical protein